MDPSYGLLYRTLYERHWWWRAREEAILAALRAAQPADGWRTVLDVGCGDGLFFDRLSEFGAVTGVEPDAALVSEQRRALIHVGPFDRTFAPSRQYSLILMLDVLEHLNEPSESLRYALELLEPGGTFVATVPAFPVLWTRHDEINQHYRRYTKNSFAELARSAGLHTTSSRYFFHWTFPVKLAQRFAEALHRPAEAFPRVPAEPINRMLYSLSCIERRMLGGFAIPFGSSLMILGGRR